uniref:Uncharacterized protein n=1 Tax=Arundo donax TaxID=35708 RepID=A0A0A9G1F6_ARUDO
MILSLLQLSVNILQYNKMKFRSQASFQGQHNSCTAGSSQELIGMYKTVVEQELLCCVGHANQGNKVEQHGC